MTMMLREKELWIVFRKLKKEHYELCIRVKNVEQKLNSALNKLTHEKKQKTSKVK